MVLTLTYRCGRSRILTTYMTIQNPSNLQNTLVKKENARQLRMTLCKSMYKVEHSTKNVHIKYAFSHTFSHSLLATLSQRDIVSHTLMKGTPSCLLAKL